MSLRPSALTFPVEAAGGGIGSHWKADMLRAFHWRRKSVESLSGDLLNE